jgi:uncharacterized RDD family membrane protein YckC
MAYDWLLLASVLFAVTLGAILLRGGEEIAPGTAWYTLLLLAVSFLFYGWFWTHGGQTLGLRAWRLRVVRADGQQVSWRDAAWRFGAATLLLVPPGLGLAWMLIDSRKACWHDLLSGTRIVRLSESGGSVSDD